MQFYTPKELARIIKQAAKRLGKEIDDEASLEIARRSRATPRIALRLLRRVRDFSDVAKEPTITLERTRYGLDALGVNALGFDEMDLKLLKLLVNNGGRAMGLSTIAAALSEDEGTIEDVIEPYLLANGYLERTAKGRIATRKSYEALQLEPPKQQGGLF